MRFSCRRRPRPADAMSVRTLARPRRALGLVAALVGACVLAGCPDERSPDPAASPPRPPAAAEVAAPAAGGLDLLSPIAAAELVVVARIVDEVAIDQDALPARERAQHPLMVAQVESTLAGDWPGERLLLWTPDAGSGERVWKTPLFGCRYALLLREHPLDPELLAGTAGDGLRVYERVAGGGALLLELSEEVRALLAEESSDAASFAAELAMQRSRLDARLKRSAGADPLDAPEPFVEALREACEFVRHPARRGELEASSRQSPAAWKRWFGAQYRTWARRQ